MSEVIISGQQWEHCNHCGEFVRIQDLKLGFSPKWPEFDVVDLCHKCFTNLNALEKSDANSI